MVLWKPFACKPAVLCQLMCSNEVEELLTVNLTRSAERAKLCLETLWMLVKDKVWKDTSIKDKTRQELALPLLYYICTSAIRILHIPESSGSKEMLYLFTPTTKTFFTRWERADWSCFAELLCFGSWALGLGSCPLSIRGWTLSAGPPTEPEVCFTRCNWPWKEKINRKPKNFKTPHKSTCSLGA